ncbi:response regulator [Clostridium sp. DJ247]|uniref:response regulator n=1 Tax=Clostridium sp. DJ247 TaxID=2726188 RepID=UPI0016296800|nr:response regulator [Clostridium sp. DJ247]MBC2579926.1 response regulator [Clostridium sp. DJ247]
MKKVLIVNDCKFESVIMKDFLMDSGYNADTANEYDVLNKISLFQPDIIIANLIMKNTRGHELIEKIKIKNPEIVCLLSSCDPIKLRDFTQNRVDEVIHTPVDKSHLIEAINRALHKHEKVILNEKNTDQIFRNLDFKRFNYIENSKEHNKENNREDNKEINDREIKFAFCPYCGHKLDAKDNGFAFCPYCGQRLSN